MNKMLKIAILGLGEAGSHFANDLVKMGVEVIGFDPNPIRKLDASIRFKNSNAEAVVNADIVFSANLSSVSVAIAEELASRHPDAGHWPANPDHRAVARSITASAPSPVEVCRAVLTSRQSGCIW